MKPKEIIDKKYREAVDGLSTIILDEKDFWYNYVINLPDHLQIIYTIVIFHQQVYNGGLHQYFFNRYGIFAFLTINNLKIIGAIKSANILESALSQVNSDNLNQSEFIDKIYNHKLDLISNFDDDLGEQLNILDESYYSLDEDLEQLIVDYLKTIEK